MLFEHHYEHSDGIGILLEDVQLAITGDDISENQLVTALSKESWPGVSKMVQKHSRGWKIGLEAEMGFPVSECYSLPLNAKPLVGSLITNLCGATTHYTWRGRGIQSEGIN